MMKLSTPHLILFETCLLLLFCSPGFTATLSRDVCKTCHQNATCIEKDNKYSCMCNFGLIGNGRTHCLDKDECQMGAHKICGEHTACHNTHGSYYCICLKGYQPSNNHENFIPNDGTFCKDIDECEDPDICGINEKCKNIPGSYECYCKEGFRLQNSTGLFQAIGGQSLCKEVDCGQPPSRPNSTMILSAQTTFGNQVTYTCISGFHSDHGVSTSVCTANGIWEGANVSCTAVDCGQPPVFTNTEIILPGPTTFSNQVTYKCIFGFHEHGHNTSVCTANGTWEGTTLVCTAIDCGTPVAKLNTVIYTFNSTMFGSSVIFMCAKGFIAVSGYNSSICSKAGHWEGANLDCRAIDCGPPVAMLNTVIHTLNSTTFESKVTFMCAKGFTAVSGYNSSECNAAGQWERANLTCRVVDCGPPPSSNYTKPDLLWNTTYGSTVNFECLPGFLLDSGNKTTTCNENGEWVGGNIVCREIDCGHPPLVPNAERKWDGNTSLGSEAEYSCQIGFYNPEIWHVSRCTSNETWENITFFCTVKKDLISNLITVNETCLQWQKSSDIFGWEIFYQFSIYGIRRNDKDFVDKKSFNYTTDNENPIVCLDLLPDTNYTVTITAISTTLPDIQLNTTVKTTTVKQTFGDIVVLNNTCLTWTRSSSAARSPVVYTVFIQGRTSSSFGLLQSIMFNFSTDKVTPVLCLDLPLAAEYFVNITEPSTELSAYAYINITKDEIENSTKMQTFNETCLFWNRSLDGLQEIYKLYVEGERWFSTELFQDLLYKINTDHNISAICLDIPLDTQYPFNVTGAFSNLVGKEPIQNLTVFNETCLIWRRHFSTKELYVFFIYGYRRNEKNISHRLMFNVTTDEKQPVMCFDLQKDINYKVEVVSAFYPQYPVQISIFTPNSGTPLPKSKIVPVHNQLPKISFQRSDRNGPISSYQVFVIQLVRWCSFTCESLEAVTYFNNISKTQGYVTAEIFPGDVSDHLEFSVGDRQYYGEFYNAPLEKGKDYCIILRTITKMRTHSCTVMAQVEGLSGSQHHITVVIVGSIAFACFTIVLSYSLARCCNSS